MNTYFATLTTTPPQHLKRIRLVRRAVCFLLSFLLSFGVVPLTALAPRMAGAIDGVITIPLSKTVQGPYYGSPKTFNFTAVSVADDLSTLDGNLPSGSGTVTLSSGTQGFAITIPIDNTYLRMDPYFMRITEIDESSTTYGWTYSDAVYYVEVYLRYNGDFSAVVADVTFINGPDSTSTSGVFVNTFAFQEHSQVVFDLTKTISGNWSDGDKQFDFTGYATWPAYPLQTGVYAVGTGSVTLASGSESFSLAVPFDLGVVREMPYYVTITEDGGGSTNNGWTYSDNSARFEVLLSIDVETGALTSSATLTSGSSATFVNTYAEQTSTVNVSIPLTKIIEGVDSSLKEFDFTAVEVSGMGQTTPVADPLGGTLTMTGATTPGNTDDLVIEDVPVPAEISTLHYFLITESNGGTTVGGWTYSSNEYWVAVRVYADDTWIIENESSTNTTAAHNVFLNTYEAAPATASITGLTKEIAGPWTGGDKQFDFTATQTDNVGNTVALPLTGTGSVTLSGGSATFSVAVDGLVVSGSPYYFVVTEDGGGTTDLGWTYSDNEHLVRVVVNDGGDGTSSTTVTPLDTNTTFTNTYAVADTYAETYELYKNIVGPWAGGDKTFMFNAVQVDALYSDTIIGSVSVSHPITMSSAFAVFTISIGPLSPSDSPYFFKVTEENGGATIDGWTYGPLAYWTEISVVDNHDGTSTASIAAETYPFEWLNTYSVEATTVVIDGLHKVTTASWTGPSPTFDFTAVQVDALGSTNVIGPATGAASTLGSPAGVPFNIAIPGLDPSGSPYYFMITEDNGGTSASGWTFSDNAYWVEVEVFDNHLGQSYYVVNYQSFDGNPTFVNTYSFDPLLLDLVGTKKTVGAPLGDKVFEFGVFFDGEMIATGANDASGAIIFDTLQVNAPGTYTVTIKEISASADGWTSDTASFEVTVYVTDNGDGTMAYEVVYPDGEVVFTNTYVAPPTPSTGDKLGALSWFALVGLLGIALIAMAIDTRRRDPLLTYR